MQVHVLTSIARETVSLDIRPAKTFAQEVEQLGVCFIVTHRAWQNKVPSLFVEILESRHITFSL